MREGFRVFYTEADELLGAIAEAEAREKKTIQKTVLEADLLILDDLLLARKIHIDAADQLQGIVHQRYKRRASTLITSNRIVSDWEKYLGDAALTTTILDRMMHRAVLVEFHGKSYRLKEAASRLARRTDIA